MSTIATTIESDPVVRPQAAVARMSSPAVPRTLFTVCPRFWSAHCRAKSASSGVPDTRAIASGAATSTAPVAPPTMVASATASSTLHAIARCSRPGTRSHVSITVPPIAARTIARCPSSADSVNCTITEVGSRCIPGSASIMALRVRRHAVRQSPRSTGSAPSAGPPVSIAVSPKHPPPVSAWTGCAAANAAAIAIAILPIAWKLDRIPSLLRPPRGHGIAAPPHAPTVLFLAPGRADTPAPPLGAMGPRVGTESLVPGFAAEFQCTSPP